MAKLDIIGAAYEEESLNISAQQCINLFLNIDEPGEGSVSSKQLLPTPGLKQMVNIAGAQVRGMIEHKGRLFAVIDNTFYELTYNKGTDDITATSRGTVENTTTRVSMAGNDTQIMIVDASANASIFTLATNTVASVTDTDMTGGITVTFIDTYFVYNTPDAATMFNTAANDGTTIGSLDFATAESRPDELLAVTAYNDEIWAFGEESIEVWFNAANASGFPFSLRSNTVFDVGCAASHSVVSFDDSIMWLDPDGVVRRVQEYEQKVVSTRAITKAISGYATISDAFAYHYAEGGHSFYVLTFPTDKKTWVYDITTGAWHERTYKSNGGSLTRHRSNAYAFHKRKHFVGDYTSGRIFRMGTDLLDDAGDEIRRVRTTRHGNFENKYATLYNVELLAEVGVGLATGQGSDPQITLEISKDGGHTFGNEIWRSLGKTGEYDQRVRWDRLGTARNFTLRFTVSDPVKVVLIDASAEVRVEGVAPK